MTEADRKEAWRLAELEYTGSDQSAKLYKRGYVDGYAAACEAKRSEIEDLKTNKNAWERWMRDCNHDLNGERARSQKLITGLKIMAIGADAEGKRAKELIAEYQSSAPSVEDLTKRGE